MSGHASLRSFLATGRLGPLAPSLTAAQVGERLGPPKDWIVNAWSDWPLYWRYGAHLEIAFDAAGATTFLQIERAADLAGPSFALDPRAADGVTVALDGLDGASTPADFLRVAQEEGAATSVWSWTPDQISVDVGEAVEIIFTVGGLATNALMDAFSRTATTDDAVAAALAADEEARLDSIYAHRTRPRRHARAISCEGAAYLAVCADAG